MDTQLLEKVEKPYLREDLPEFRVGDTIAVSYKVLNEKGEVRRVQVFKGLVIAIKNSGTRKSFTIRKIGANGIGVERIFPINSPNIESIEVLKRGKVRRSKIYYMRSRVGKSAMKVDTREDLGKAPEYVEPKEEVEELKAKDSKEDKVEPKAKKDKSPKK